jgi:hypothetical protein
MNINRTIKYCPVGICTIAMILAGLVHAREKDSYPEVINCDVPIYSVLARIAKIEGTVHVKVKTNGKAVIEAKTVDGNYILGNFAEANSLTWRFKSHDPTSFTIMYKYKLVTELSEEKIIFRLPYEVEIYATPAPPLVNYEAWSESSK